MAGMREASPTSALVASCRTLSCSTPTFSGCLDQRRMPWTPSNGCCWKPAMKPCRQGHPGHSQVPCILDEAQSAVAVPPSSQQCFVGSVADSKLAVTCCRSGPLCHTNVRARPSWLDGQGFASLVRKLQLERVWFAGDVAKNVGVAVGVMYTEYYLNAAPQGTTAYSATSGTLSVVCGRVSFTLGLKGPSVSIDTACSSSLARPCFP